MQLSIIVPFYNSSNFLANCLNSFKKINKETEIILINDGSSDNPDKIINAFKRNKNYNIKYISLKKNKGVSFCRNLGIAKSKGKYIYFIDSDDQLFSNTLKVIHRNLKKYEKDTFIIFSKSLIDFKVDKNQFLKINSNKNILNNIKRFDLFRATCWNFIVRRELIIKNKIFFGSSKIFEDQIFVTKTLLKTKSFGLIKETFYGKGLDNINSLSKNVGKIVLHSCFVNLANLALVLKQEQKKRKSIKINFIKSRINFFKNELILNSLITTNKEISKLDKKFNVRSLKFLRNKSIVDKKKHTINKLIKRLKVYQNKKLIIFCAGTFAKIIASILQEHKFKIIFCVDTNKYLHGESLLSIPIFNKSFMYRNMKNFNLNPVIICNRSIDASKTIKKELIINNFKKVIPIKL